MKRWLIYAVLVLWGGGLAWLLFFRPTSHITNQNFAVLQVGMTQAQVERILGGPARDECGQPVIVWVPRGDTLNSLRIDPESRRDSILFREDSPAPGTREDVFVVAGISPRGDHELVWLSDSLLIAILFDENGRLIEKHSSDVTVLDRPDVLDWLRSRF